MWRGLKTIFRPKKLQRAGTAPPPLPVLKFLDTPVCIEWSVLYHTCCDTGLWFCNHIPTTARFSHFVWQERITEDLSDSNLDPFRENHQRKRSIFVAYYNQSTVCEYILTKIIPDSNWYTYIEIMQICRDYYGNMIRWLSRLTGIYLLCSSIDQEVVNTSYINSSLCLALNHQNMYPTRQKIDVEEWFLLLFFQKHAAMFTKKYF